MIKFYKTNDPYGFLNNFYKSKMTIYARTWNFVEAPYQAAKTNIQDEKDKIWGAKTARESRDLGQLVQIRSDWNDIKDSVMKECLIAKFSQNPDLLKQLIDTGDEELVEESPVDNYWRLWG